MATSGSRRSPDRPPTTRRRRPTRCRRRARTCGVTRDEFHFAWRKLSGDFIVRTHAAFVGDGVDPHRKLGWIVRQTPRRRCAVCRCRGARRRADVAAVPPHGRARHRAVQVAGQGARTSFSSSARRHLHHVGGEVRRAVHAQPRSADVDLGDEVYVGLFLCSHNAEGRRERATFRNVRIVVPPKAGWRAVSRLHRQQPRGAGRRRPARARCSTPRPISHAGAELDDRRRGAHLQRQRPLVPLRPGDAARRRSSTPASRRRNNNDHVLSFDGKSSASATTPRRTTTVGRLHGAGRRAATPKRITANSPSYLHGWSPDAQVADLHRRSATASSTSTDLRRRRRGGAADRRAGRRRWVRVSRRTASGSTSTRPAPDACRSGG